MKRAVSISLGSSKRNKAVVVTLLGQAVSIERIGTDGDMEKAAQLYRDLDGCVDAFGVGGADLGITVEGRWYPLHGVRPMVRFVKQTPLVDGAGLKNTLERRAAPFLDQHIRTAINPRRVMFTGGLDRWGMTRSFHDAGYEYVFGDLMFGLGLPIPIRSLSWAQMLGRLLLPVIGRLPFEWLYPIGEKQEKWEPKFEPWYRWATVIAGDCHYIKRHMPVRLDGKIICTNTTTPEDVERFRAAGVRYLLTTTPILEGRSFGTNLMEAALIAASGRGRALTPAELDALIATLGFQPTLQQLNE
jgi:hypothetical protein